MDYNLIGHYFLAIVTLPVSIYTIKSVIENAGTLFDDDLTIKDRTLLKQFAFFVLLPLVVLFHELGHALAARYYGATISAFHWSMFWGEVVIDGRLSPVQQFVIALSGNVFQLTMCFFALALAFIEGAPALVALSIYFYLFNGLACLIGYPLLSLTAWNDDFSVIYGQPTMIAQGTITGVIHLLLIALFLWSCFSTKCRLWFVKKTRPLWFREFSKVLARAQQEDDAVNYLAVAWQYYFVGLDALCAEALDKVEERDPQLMDVWLLRGYINQSKSRYDSAILCFKEITDKDANEGRVNEGNLSEDKVLKARAWMARGHCLTQKIETPGKSAQASAWHEVLKTYKQASLTDASLADPHYYLGLTLIKAGLAKDAEAEFLLCQNSSNRALTWLDPVLGSMVQVELNAIRSQERSQQ
jgi:tetratricopeptide (TPR) repeat protein